MVLPDTPLFRRYAQPIKDAVTAGGIRVYWVSSDSVVSVWDDERHNNKVS
jgi:hypothetical protein